MLFFGRFMVTNKHIQLSATSTSYSSVTFKGTFFRVSLFALIWVLLSNGDLGSWVVGIPMVIIATYVSVKLLPPLNFSVVGTLRFIPFFISHSFYGGLDVAKRAIFPRMAISPDMIDYKTQLPSEASRVMMANVISLLPGTLVAEMHQDKFRIHILDHSSDLIDELMLLEKRVGAMFGFELHASSQ